MNPLTFKNQIKSVLCDNRLTRYVSRARTGKLDFKRLHFALITSRVFKHKAEYGSKEYNVLIMVDCSGSMVHGPARDILVSTLEKFLPEFSPLANVFVYGFNARLHKFLTPADKLDMPGLISKINLECDFKNNPTPYSYANHDGYCIAQAYKDTIRGLKGQGVIIVLTDGNPHCDYHIGSGRGKKCQEPGCGDDQFQKAQLIKTVSDLKKEHVEIIGIGLGTDSVKSFYRIAQRVDDLEGLYTAVVSNLKKIIKKPVVG